MRKVCSAHGQKPDTCVFCNPQIREQYRLLAEKLPCRSCGARETQPCHKLTGTGRAAMNTPHQSRYNDAIDRAAKLEKMRDWQSKYDPAALRVKESA